MEGPQKDDQEHHLEEGDEDVGGGHGQTDDPQYRRDSALADGETKPVQTKNRDR